MCKGLTGLVSQSLPLVPLDAGLLDTTRASTAAAARATLRRILNSFTHHHHLVAVAVAIVAIDSISPKTEVQRSTRRLQSTCSSSPALPSTSPPHSSLNIIIIVDSERWIKRQTDSTAPVLVLRHRAKHLSSVIEKLAASGGGGSGSGSEVTSAGGRELAFDTTTTMS